MKNYSTQLWLITAALGSLVMLIVLVLGSCVVVTIYTAVVVEHRKQELLRREPWRRFE